ncbi:MAG TPA: helix-turn-helix transcriptional regulator [Chloroflexota bacterium]|nr:helix-turn-helix transcriptional regulator [Chloroflexota bacterium]
MSEREAAAARPPGGAPARAVGRVVHRLRRERGEGLRELARRAGLSANQLSRIERLAASPTEEKIAGLAAALGVPVATLFGQSGVAPPAPVPAGGDAGHQPPPGAPASPAGPERPPALPAQPVRPTHAVAYPLGPPVGEVPSWAWPALAEWERFLAHLIDDLRPLEERREAAAAVTRQLLERRLALARPAFYQELRRVWQTGRGLEGRLAAAAELFQRYRPRDPGAALMFPRLRYVFEYREDGWGECRHELSLANLGDEPIACYQNRTGGAGLQGSSPLGLRVVHPDGTPAATVSWLPRSGPLVRWTATLLHPLQPRECRELVETWLCPYPLPLAGVRHHADAVTVHTFTGEVEVEIGYPPGYRAALTTAWVREGDGAARLLDVRLSNGGRLRLRDALPPFDGSGQPASYSVLQQIVMASSSIRSAQGEH